MRLRSKETFDGTEKPGKAAGAARSAATEGALPGFFTFLAVVLCLAPLWWLPPQLHKISRFVGAAAQVAGGKPTPAQNYNFVSERYHNRRLSERQLGAGPHTRRGCFRRAFYLTKYHKSVLRMVFYVYFLFAR